MCCLAHVPGTALLYAGMETGDLVTVDLLTAQVASRIKLGGDTVGSLLHCTGEKRLFAGLGNGDLVTVDGVAPSEGEGAT